MFLYDYGTFIGTSRYMYWYVQVRPGTFIGTSRYGYGTCIGTSRYKCPQRSGTVSLNVTERYGTLPLYVTGSIVYYSEFVEDIYFYGNQVVINLANTIFTIQIFFHTKKYRYTFNTNICIFTF